MGPIAKGPQPADLEYEVTESVVGVFDADESRVQFRLQFPIANDQQFDQDVQLITNVALWVLVGYP
jgi:hypothetical protein